MLALGAAVGVGFAFLLDISGNSSWAVLLLIVAAVAPSGLASRGFTGQIVGRQVISAVVRDALKRGPSGSYWGRGAIEGVSYRLAGFWMSKCLVIDSTR